MVNRDTGVAVARVMARLADGSPDQVASIRLTGGGAWPEAPGMPAVERRASSPAR